MESFAPAAYDWIWTGILLAYLAVAAVAVLQINRSARLSASVQLVWTLAVLLLPVLVVLAWFVAGPRRPAGTAGLAARRARALT